MNQQAVDRLDAADTERPLIYISGPISKGNRNLHLLQSLEAHRELMQCGFSVINPMLNMLAPFNSSLGDAHLTHEDWMENDLPCVRVADAVLRLPGHSLGGDMECLYAERVGVPVYKTVEELICVFSYRPSVGKAVGQRAAVTKD